MKILHTADWHLGHHLHGHDRAHEHLCFLDWLSNLIAERQIDALLVAGDLFDTANPGAGSWQMFYRFLAHLHQRFPHLNVVAIGGNHDSPSRLDAPHELLRAFELHLIGAISRDSNGTLDIERLIVPLTDATGEVQAWCAAVPYLRTADLRLESMDEGEEDRLIAGVRRVYQQVLAAIAARRQPHQPVIAMGHAYLVNSQLSELSERRILGGNQHALPTDLFAGADYVALGHLHLAQGPAAHIQYSGSPLPLSLSEAAYRHQVLELEADADGVRITQRHRVPRTVDILRLPDVAAPLSEVEGRLRDLDLPLCADEVRPFVEVRVALDQPEPRLRERIVAALAGKPVRLARITTEYPGQGHALADCLVREQLDDLTPEQVFTLCYERQFAAPPPPDLQQAFDTLLADYQERDA